MLLQLSDNFTVKSFPDLEKYLETLPRTHAVALEVRHHTWFEPENFEKLMSVLKKNNIGTAITDSPARRDGVHMGLPTPDLFVRYVDSADSSDEDLLNAWVERIATWRAQGLKKVWFFVHAHKDYNGPEMIDTIAKKINDRLKLEINRPKFLYLS